MTRFSLPPTSDLSSTLELIGCTSLITATGSSASLSYSDLHPKNPHTLVRKKVPSASAIWLLSVKREFPVHPVPLIYVSVIVTFRLRHKISEQLAEPLSVPKSPLSMHYCRCSQGYLALGPGGEIFQLGGAYTALPPSWLPRKGLQSENNRRKSLF